MEISILEWIFIGISSFALGISKAGLKGFGVLMIAVMAVIFGAKASTGILVPMLIAGDIMAVIYYNRHAKWIYVFKLMPSMVIGVLIAVLVGKNLPEHVFKWGMAIIILLGVFSMYLWDKGKIKAVPDSQVVSGTLGFLAGFTTMIGNLAGAFANLYFLAMKMPKNNFIGTAAWVFFIINVFKLPFHVFSWKTITYDTFLLNLKLLPFEILGFLMGVWLIRMISEKFFRNIVLILTAVGAIIILLK